MDLKVLQNNEDRTGIDLVPSIGAKVPLVLGAALLAILGTHVELIFTGLIRNIGD